METPTGETHDEHNGIEDYHPARRIQAAIGRVENLAARKLRRRHVDPLSTIAIDDGIAGNRTERVMTTY